MIEVMDKFDRTKRTRKKESSEFDNEHLCATILKSVREAAVDGEIKVSGQLLIQKPGQPDFPIVLHANPSGGFMCWIIDGNFPPQYRVFALVNENFKEIATYPLANHTEFQEKLAEIQKEMGE